MYKGNLLPSQDSSPHSPHMIIPTLIRAKTEVLDVGCNTGFLGKTLLKKTVITDGVDINGDALKIAKNWYRKVYRRDLYKGRLDVDRRRYDYIVCADILEHLPRPDLVLIDCQKYLKKNGHIIISLPNIARLELRLWHLLGNFDYAPGIMSEDHLRFYTRDSAIKMLDLCRLKVEKIIPTGLGHRLRILSTITAFQFIFVCKKTERGA